MEPCAHSLILPEGFERWNKYAMIERMLRESLVPNWPGEMALGRNIFLLDEVLGFVVNTVG